MQRFYLIMPIQVGWNFRKGQGTLATYIGKFVRPGKMRDAAALLGVLFEANIKWISSRSEPRPFVLSSSPLPSSAMRITLPLPPQPDQVRLPKYVFAILPGRVEILQ